MKKTIFALMLATLFFGALQANPVDVATAKSLGVKFMKANTAIKAEAAELTYTAYAENGQAAFYVFALQPLLPSDLAGRQECQDRRCLYQYTRYTRVSVSC